MLRELFRSHAQRVYGASALALLILTPLGYARLPRWDVMPSVIGAVCFAALACLMAWVQSGLALPARAGTLLAWSYALGTVLLMTGWPLWHELHRTWIRDPQWSRRLGMIDLVLPVMILLPVGAVLVGALRGRQAWPEGAYLVGGLCLMVLFLGKTWLNLYEIWFTPFTSPEAFLAALFWTPVCLVVATLGMLLGCLPHDFHQPVRRGSVLAVCYLVAVAVVPLGFYAHLTRQYDYAYLATLAVALGVFVPASLATRGWVVTRSVKR